MKNIYYIGISKDKMASIDLAPYDKGWMITRIFVPEDCRRQGFGSQVLKLVLEDADIEHVILYLPIHPYSNTEYQRLEAWYKRHGFKRQRGLFHRRPFVKDKIVR